MELNPLQRNVLNKNIISFSHYCGTQSELKAIAELYDTLGTFAELTQVHLDFIRGILYFNAQKYMDSLAIAERHPRFYPYEIRKHYRDSIAEINDLLSAFGFLPISDN